MIPPQAYNDKGKEGINMELVAGFLLSVVIVLAGILHSKNTNESVTVEKEDKVETDIQKSGGY